MNNPALRDALQNLKKKAVETGVFKGAVLYPQVPALDRRVESWMREEKDDMINLSTDTNSFIGRTIGFSKGPQFKDIATGLKIASLAGYWRYLVSGQRHTPLLNDRTDVPFKPVAYVRHMYAFLAMAIWSKLTSNEDLRTVASAKLPRFDFFFFASADQRDRSRVRDSAIIIDMYARINHALSTGRLPEFYRWFDVDVQDELRAAANDIRDIDERQAYYARVLAETFAVAKARNETRRADRRQKQEEEKSAKPAKAEAEVAQQEPILDSAIESAVQAGQLPPDTPVTSEAAVELPQEPEAPQAAHEEDDGTVIVMPGFAPVTNSLSV